MNLFSIFIILYDPRNDTNTRHHYPPLASTKIGYKKKENRAVYVGKKENVNLHLSFMSFYKESIK
jgi:hypothetical protein